MPFLVIMDGALKGKRFALPDEATRVGRVDGNEIVLDFPSVSSGHAVIRKEGDVFHLRDLASTNGTRVNGHRVTDAILYRDDEVLFGDVSTVFTGEDAPVRSGPVHPVAAEVPEPVVLPVRPPVVVASKNDGRPASTVCPSDFRKRRDLRMVWVGVIGVLLILIGVATARFIQSFH